MVTYFVSRDKAMFTAALEANSRNRSGKLYTPTDRRILAMDDLANFWLGVITDLKQRGVRDLLIACIDGLKGFEEAIRTIFPDTEVQTCVVHQIRNSLKYVASKDQKAFMADLKPVYQAMNKIRPNQTCWIWRRSGVRNIRW
jgi:hypothetical protein